MTIPSKQKQAEKMTYRVYFSVDGKQHFTARKAKKHNQELQSRKQQKQNSKQDSKQ